MTEHHSDADASGPRTGDPERPSAEETGESMLKAEAERYASVAAEQPDRAREERNRIVELLCADVAPESFEEGLKRRAAASRALTLLAQADIDTVGNHVPDLVDELRAERTRETSSKSTQMRAVSHEITDNLVRTIALIIAEQPDIITELGDLSEYIRSISTDLETGTLRPVTKAFFVSTSELQQTAAAVETLDELLKYPDGVVQAWGAGALGRLAAEDPDTVASAADTLRNLLDVDDETVQHNAVEALGTLVCERPEAVVPAADTLQELLDHEEVAIRHNAAGVLGRLAETHPDAVIPAVEPLTRLCDHDDESVRRTATSALARLVQKRPEAVAER